MSCWKALLLFLGLTREVVDSRDPESQCRDAATPNLATAPPPCSTRSKYKIEVESLESKDIIIALMGPTGTGKSSFINMVVTAGEDDTEASVKVGHTLESCTSEITMVGLRDPSSNSRIVLVDTPAFDDWDTNKNDTAILTLIADLLESTHKKDVKLAGIIYMQKISDNRNTAGTPLKNLTMFEKLCGEHALKNVILATTMWDEVGEKKGSQREIELGKNYWKGMVDVGSKTFRYTRDPESAWAVMRHFLDLYTWYSLQLHQAATALQSRTTGLLQRARNTPLPETKVFASLEAMIAKQQQTLNKRKQATEEELLKILKAEFESQREQLGKLQQEADIMKVPFMRWVISLLSSWHR